MNQINKHNFGEIDPRLYSVLAILTPMGRIHATGFLIAPGLAVTCAHILRDIYAGPGGSVRTRLAFERQTRYTIVVPEFWRPSLDIAFLRFTLDLPEEAKPVQLASAQDCIDSTVWAYGYPAGADGIWGEGRIVDFMKDFSEGQERVLLQIASQEINANFSGGPLWDPSSGYVIGMITDIKKQDRFGSVGQVSFATMADNFLELNSALQLGKSSSSQKPGPTVEAADIPDDHGQENPEKLADTATLVTDQQDSEKQPLHDTEVTPIRFSIASPPDIFVGREEQIVQLMRAFLPDQKPSGQFAAMITGVSSGSGIGKTALARLIAGRLAGRFPDARLEIDLNGSATRTERALTVEEAQRRLLIPFQRGRLPDDPRRLNALYWETFSNMRALLLLDNAADAGQIRPLLPPPPSGAIVTSRQYFEIPEVDLDIVRVGILDEVEARKLLRTITLRLVGEFDQTINELAERCGKIPLALHIAGALLSERTDWNLADYLARQANFRRRLLSQRHPDDPNLDVETTIDLSYQSLDANLQKLWQTLAVFPRNFEWTAMAEIWDEEDAAALQIFVDRHLLDYHVGTNSYTLHQLLREFALTQLIRANRNLAQTIIMRHAKYSLMQAGKIYRDYKQDHDKTMATQRFSTLWPDLTAAWERLSGSQPAWPLPENQAGREAVERWLSNLPIQVSELLEFTLSWNEQERLYMRALQAARLLDDKPAQGFHLASLANIYSSTGNTRRSIEFHEQHIEIARQIGDQRAEGNAQAAIGTAYLALNEFSKALEYHQLALNTKRQTGNQLGEATSLAAMGLAYKNLNNIAEARVCWEAALAIYRAKGSTRAVQVQTWLHALGP